MTKRNKYSEWEYEEIEMTEEEKIQKSIDDESKEEAEEKTAEELEAEQVAAAKEAEEAEKAEALADDAVVKVKIDGVEQEVTLAELKSGYMRHSDYTKKTQEIASMSKKDQDTVVEKAKEVIENKDEFPEADVKAAEYIVKIAKQKFGLMTRDELEAEKTQERQVADIAAASKSAKEFSEEIRKTSAGKGVPAYDEDAVIEHMKKTGIHNFTAAYKDMNEAAIIDYRIKLAKGSTAYKSDKNGGKIETQKKEFNPRNPDDFRNSILDDITKSKGTNAE